MRAPLDELASSVGEHLRAEADSIVEQWIQWVRNQVRTPTIAALPERALRNHVPPVLRSLADYISHPLPAVRETMLGHLRLHGQIRRDQGYAVHEVLSEFDGLAYLTSRCVHEHLAATAEDAASTDLLEISSRLAAGLRAISFACVGAHHESDARLRKSLSSQLEEFSRAVAHELRNPLNTANLVAHSLRDDALAADPNKRDEQLDALRVAIDRASQFLDNIRVLAVASAAQAGDDLIELTAAVDTALAELSDVADEFAVDLRLGELPEIHAESILLHLVLVNLIGNAIKYHDPGKDERYVEISGEVVPEENDSGFCQLLVEDNGVGIPEEMLPRILQNGFRANPDRGQGTGLGLYIVQRMLVDRGGTIDVSSRAGQGTQVTCRFRCLEIAPGSRQRRDLRTSSLADLRMERRIREQLEGETAE